MGKDQMVFRGNGAGNQLSPTEYRVELSEIDRQWSGVGITSILSRHLLLRANENSKKRGKTQA